MIQIFEVGGGKIALTNTDIIVKSNLKKVSADEIIKLRCKAYKYIL